MKKQGKIKQKFGQQCDYRPLEVDAYTNPTLAPKGESPLVQF